MFKEEGYIVVRNLIPSQMCQPIQEGIDFLRKKNLLRLGDRTVEKAYCAYGTPVTERLLQMLCPIVSKLVGAPLYPTYSYLRLYLNGAILPKHIDRESCE